jgi:hypothetical protein
MRFSENRRASCRSVSGTRSLVEHQDDLVRLVRDRTDHLELIERDWRVGTQDDEGRVDLGHEGLGRGRALTKRGSQSRGVDEAHARGEKRMGKGDLDRYDILAVSRVAALGDIGRQIGDRDERRAAVSHMDGRLPVCPVTDERDDRGGRYDAGREERLAEQRVQEG